jgi:hypothetical protein
MTVNREEILNVYQLISYDRISEMFSDIFWRSISTGTVAVQDCHPNFADVEERIRELLMARNGVINSAPLFWKLKLMWMLFEERPDRSVAKRSLSLN